MSDELQLAPGQLFAHRYLLEQLIGRGGMGTVWRARDQKSKADVALKIITPRGKDGKPSATAVGRFTREARAMARLRSPHVVRVLDHGADGPLAYIAMELLNGISLHRALKTNGALSIEQTLRIMTHVGRAVALAHQRGIVHRDLKPGNIFLCDFPGRNFTAKVLDFGMAKSLAVPLGTVDQVQTRRGRPIGTPYYMSPEQAHGSGGVDHRSDLWSMGVITYECLCGRRPFAGKSLVVVLTAITSEQPAPPSSVAEVPPAFDGWFYRALQRDVQQRFQTVSVLLHELREALGADALRPASSRRAVLSSAAWSGVSSAAWGGYSHTDSPGFESPGVGDRTVKRDSSVKGSSFVARDDKMTALDDARSNHCRVLTLTGPAGTGRSRLAREYAIQRQNEFPGGIWVCSAEDIYDECSLWLRVAGALDASLTDTNPAASLGHALGSLGRAMLLIERAEGCQPALSDALRQWLTLAPDIVVAVTTNEPLRVPTERVIALEGLAFSAAPQQGKLTRLNEHPASILLLRRAVSYRRQLLSEHQYTQAIGNIARSTRGGPLALELLAGFFVSATPDTIASELARSIREQADGEAATPAQTMAGVLRWIWSRLSQTDRAMLTQLSCFAGGFDVAAAEAVVELSEDAEAVVADELEALCNRGFLSREEHSEEPRYQLHAALRPHYNAQLRNSGDPVWTAAVRRHAGYFAQLGETNAVETLAHFGGARRRQRYLAEMVNLDTAMHFSRENVSAEVAAAHARALAALQRSYGLRGKAVATLMAAGSVVDLDDQVRHELQVERARALLDAGRSTTARLLLEQAEQHSDSEDALLNRIVRLKARCALAVGEVWLAYTLASHALELSETEARALDIAKAKRLQARAAMAIGNFAQAGSLFEAAATSARAVGASRLEAVCCAAQGNVERLMGQRQQARMHLEQALRHCYRLGDRRDEARVLGMLARAQDEPSSTSSATSNKTDAHSSNAAAQASNAAAQASHAAAQAAPNKAQQQDATQQSQTQQADAALGEPPQPPSDSISRLLERAVGRSRELGDFELELGLLTQLTAQYETIGSHSHARHALRRAERLLSSTRSSDGLLAGLLLRRARLELCHGSKQAAQQVLRSIQLVAARSPDALTPHRKALLRQLQGHLAGHPAGALVTPPRAASPGGAQ